MLKFYVHFCAVCPPCIVPYEMQYVRSIVATITYLNLSNLPCSSNRIRRMFDTFDDNIEKYFLSTTYDKYIFIAIANFKAWLANL